MALVIEITSVQNPKVKGAVKLMNRRERDATKRYLIEGQREVQRAFETNTPIEALFLCKDFFASEREGLALVSLLDEKGVELFMCSEAVFKKMSYRDSPDGFLAIGIQQRKTLSDLDAILQKTTKPLLLVAEGVEKPGNLGTLLRSCDAAGVDALILSDKLTDIYNPNVVRASVGTLFSIPVIEAEGQEIIRYLKKNQIKIIALTPEGARPYTECPLDQGFAVVVGTEHEGLSPLWKKEADVCAAIPMHGLADSLNVSTAATIILYEALRKRSL